MGCITGKNIQVFKVLVQVTLVFGNLFTVKAKTVEDVANPSIISKEKVTESDLSVAKVSSLTTNSSSGKSDEEMKPVTFGPYNEEDTNKEHAYNPFEEKKEDDSTKDLGYRKDRLLVKYKDSVSKVKSGTYSVKGKTLSLNHGVG